MIQKNARYHQISLLKAIFKNNNKIFRTKSHKQNVIYIHENKEEDIHNTFVGINREYELGTR